MWNDPGGQSSLQWRHNDHDGVLNHQPHGCLLNRLFGRRSKKTSKLRVTGLCAGNSPGPVNTPHKGPVTRKMFPFDDVIMWYSEVSTKWTTFWRRHFQMYFLDRKFVHCDSYFKYIPKGPVDNDNIIIGSGISGDLKGQTLFTDWHHIGLLGHNGIMLLKQNRERQNRENIMCSILYCSRCKILFTPHVTDSINFIRDKCETVLTKRL